MSGVIVSKALLAAMALCAGIAALWFTGCTQSESAERQPQDTEPQVNAVVSPTPIVSTPTAAPMNSPEPKPTVVATVIPTNPPEPTPTVIPTAAPTSTPEPTSTAVATAAPVPPEIAVVPTFKRGFSRDRGELIPYVAPANIDGSGKKLLAIYMVGSDLEEDYLAGTTDLLELIAGYETLSDGEAVEIVVAFGGARKAGWQGMKFAEISQLIDDAQDFEFGNEVGSDAYLYRAHCSHMGDESSLRVFLDYLRDGYASFDVRFLTFWDHGDSYKGFGNDTNFNGDALTLEEMRSAFENSQPGGFDLLGFDACLMATIEVAKTVEPFADYMIASTAIEPGRGWHRSAVMLFYVEESNIAETGTLLVDNFVQDVHVYTATGKTLSLLYLNRYDELVTALDAALFAVGDQVFN